MTTRSRPAWRRRRLVLLAAALALLALFLWMEQTHIETERIPLVHPRLPEAFAGLRIAHLSDLHGKEFGRDSAALLAAVAAAKPHLIAMTGDMVDRSTQVGSLLALARGLVAIAPTYYVTGNHEWGAGAAEEVKEVLTTCGVTVLSGEYVVLTRGDQRLILAGVDDPNGYADQITPEQLRQTIWAEQGDGFTILLSHRNTVEEYGRLGYDGVLCGHGHGGMIRIPVVDRGLLGTDRTLFPEYDGGVYQMSNDGWCLVSRGLGNHTTMPAFRLFNRPHLPVVELYCNGRN